MSKALLKKSMQFLDDSQPKHIFTKAKEDTSKSKNGKVKKRKQKKVVPMKPELTGSSKVDANVKQLLKLSSFKLNDKLVQSAFKRSASRHYTLPDKEKAPAQSASIFSEEDFARFEAEYTV